MSTPFLVRHPAPYRTESITGYVLRLSEKNGHSSPWSVCRLAGMRQNEMRTTGIKVEKLAMIARLPTSQLSDIAFAQSANHQRGCRLLGHHLVPTDLNVTNPKLCPRCVAEEGFIEAHWQLQLMVACPTHQRLALSTCPKCSKRLSWFRPGLLECKCGGNLLDGELRSISEPEASLLDLIRRKVLALPPPPENLAALPQDQLMTMNLRSILAVVRTLGKHRMIANGLSAWNDEQQIVKEASRVLMNWPKHFIELFADLGRTLPATTKGGVGKQFASIYHALFKNQAIRPQEHTGFLRVAFLDFAMNHWGRGFVDHKLVKQLGDTAPKRYLTQTEFAAHIGVEQSTAARLLKNQKASSKRIKCGKSERILVDTSQSAIPRTSPGRIFRNREAAGLVGLPVSVLQALKREGVYEVNHLLPTRAGFHELDIEAFRQKLLVLTVCHDSPPSVGHACIALRAVMQGRHDSLETKLSVFRAVLANKIAIVGNADGTSAGLLLDDPACKAFVKGARIRAAGNALTPTEVAKTTGCDQGTVPGLVQLGLLNGIATPVGLRITDESVEAFKNKYVCLARLAKNGATSSRALMQTCRDHGISMLLVPTTRKGGPQPFIRLVDRKRLGQRSHLPVQLTAAKRIAGTRDPSVALLQCEEIKEGVHKQPSILSVDGTFGAIS
jgi:hypothetical protein